MAEGRGNQGIALVPRAPAVARLRLALASLRCLPGRPDVPLAPRVVLRPPASGRLRCARSPSAGLQGNRFCVHRTLRGTMKNWTPGRRCTGMQLSLISSFCARNLAMQNRFPFRPSPGLVRAPQHVPPSTRADRRAHGDPARVEAASPRSWPGAAGAARSASPWVFAPTGCLWWWQRTWGLRPARTRPGDLKPRRTPGPAGLRPPGVLDLAGAPWRGLLGHSVWASGERARNAVVPRDGAGPVALLDPTLAAATACPRRLTDRSRWGGAPLRSEATVAQGRGGWYDGGPAVVAG